MLGLPQPGRTRSVVRVSPANRRVTDGARPRDLRDHNPMLCQLSYDPQAPPRGGLLILPATTHGAKRPRPSPPTYAAKIPGVSHSGTFSRCLKTAANGTFVV